AAFRVDVARHVHDESHAAGVRVELRIEARDGVYDGELVALDSDGNRGSRQISGETCAEVAHALAFLAGLVTQLGGHIDSGAPSAMPSPPPQPARASIPKRAGTPPSGPRVSAVLLADTRGAFAPGLRPTGEIGVELGARSTRLWSPAARLLAFVGNSQLQGSDGSAALRFIGGRLELCPLRFGNTSFVLRPCAGGELGAVEARGHVGGESKTLTEPWASAEVTLRVQWVVTKWFFAELGFGPVLPVARTHYFFEPNRTLYSVPDVSARAALGLGLIF
ncbi:MAG TPA: hypothetical protein VK745_30905, partial [Polyangiaceae bacterium]|nr:hypothetical protein [Polyangiaceae bacterium]